MVVLSRRIPAVPLAALAFVVAVAAPAAGAAPLARQGKRPVRTLRKGVYDCMALNVVTGFLDYKESVALRRRGRYQQAFGRKGTRLIKPTAGTYRIKGSRVMFHGGALGRNPGRIYRHGSGFPYFALLLHGKPSGWACYYVPKP